MTRQLNKGTHQTPYSVGDAKKSKGRETGGDAEPELMDEETVAAMLTPDDEDERETDNVEKDAMIKVKKSSKASKPSTSAAAKATDRGGKSGRGGRDGGSAKTSAGTGKSVRGKK